MATKFTIQHSFSNISLEKFETYLNHPKLNELLKKELDFEERELVKETKRRDGGIEWQFKVKKVGDVPAGIKKLIGGNALGWLETSHFDPKEHCVHWEIEPAVKNLPFTGRGVWRLKKNGKGCDRTIEGEITVGLPLIGKIAESFIVNELKKVYEVEPAVQEKFYANLESKDA